MNKKIKSINARHILDSRANPTIEVEVTTSDNIKGRAQFHLEPLLEPLRLMNLEIMILPLMGWE